MNFNTSKALNKVWVLSTTWTDCPEEVKDVVRGMWRERELGNDHYVIFTSIDSLKEEIDFEESKENLQIIVDYLESKGVGPEEEVIIHYWW